MPERNSTARALFSYGDGGATLPLAKGQSVARTVRYSRFGGPEVLEVVDVEEAHAGPGEIRVRVAAAGLNPVDFKIFAGGDVAAAFGGAPGSGVGYDLAGTVDEVGEGVTDFSIGDRVFGGKRHEAIADYVVLDPSKDTVIQTPAGLENVHAAALPIAGRTAFAAIDQLHLEPSDTVLIGGAAGGVGIFAVQLAVATGATVIATASESNHEALRALGAVPVTYGDGLVERVRAIGVPTAAADLHGTDTIAAARELGVPGERITAIAAYGADAEGVIDTGGHEARPGALQDLAAAVAEGSIVVPIEATYPIDDVSQAYARLIDGHLFGKIVVIVDETEGGTNT